MWGQVQLQLCLVKAREVQHLLNQAYLALTLFSDALDGPDAAWGVQNFSAGTKPLQDFGQTLNSGDGRPQFMACQREEVIFLPLQAFAFGDILEDGHCSGNLPLLCPQGGC